MQKEIFARCHSLCTRVCLAGNGCPQVQKSWEFKEGNYANRVLTMTILL